MALLLFVVVRNAFDYEPISGFDAEEHIGYARTLVEEWRIPTSDDLGNYYTPPGFFLLAGGALKAGELLGLTEPERLGQLLNGVLTVGTAALTAALCGVVFPRRPWLRLAALALFVCSPVVLKMAAMFHPQPLVSFLAALALVLVARMIRDARYGVGAAVILGLVVGAGQLVRSVGLWAFGVVCLSLLIVAVFHNVERRAALRALAIVGILGALIALPWYAHLHSRYSNPVFGRAAPVRRTIVPSLVPGQSAAPPPFRLVAAAPGFSSQRLWFYVDPGLPNVITGPQRGKLAPAFWPVLYTDYWGDFFGNWTWGATQEPMTESVENRLTVQSIVGIVPTFLAAVGLLAVAGLAALRVRTRPELLPVALMPLAALAGTLYYAYSYPSTDGDTVKALFILPGVAAIAVCFGFAVETLGRRSRPLAFVLATVLVVCFSISIAFGFA
jgi:4-amino-4-deoxy-L-arabinose transferase-like glycosyltransferase